MKKYAAAVLSAAIAFSVLAGCGRSNNISSGAGATDYPVTIGSVTIAKEPSGVAVLSPNAADIVISLGYELSLKAKSADCTQKDLAVLPEVTADAADQIKGYGADLVIADSSLTQAQQNALQKNGITVLVLQPAASRSALSALYSQIGAAIKGASTGYNRGQKAASDIFTTIDDITRSIPAGTTPVTAVYLYDAEGSAATGDTVAGGLVKSAGFQNVAENAADGKYPLDTLLLSNPAYIFCAPGVKAKLEASDRLSSLNAVRDGKVYEMSASLMQLQGDSMIDAVSFMAGTAYPELVQNTSSAETVSQASSGTSSVSANGLNLSQTLQYGMQSDDVLKLQKRLDELGYMFVEPSGYYLEGTQQSVKDFQYLNGMTVTGVADPDTLQKIFSSDAVPRT